MHPFIRFISLLFVLIFVSHAVAQNLETLLRSETQIEQYERAIDALFVRYDENSDNQNVLIDIGAEADELKSPIADLLATFSQQLAVNQERLTVLNDGSEAEAVIAERKNLNEVNALLTVYIGRLETAIADLEELSLQVSTARRNIFTNQLFERVSFSSLSIDNLAVSLGDKLSEFYVKTSAWLTFVWEFKTQPLIISISLSVVLGGLIYLGLYRFVGRFIHSYGQLPAPDYGSRLTSAFWSAVIPTVTVAAIGASTILLLKDFSVLRIDFENLLIRIVQSLVAFVLVYNLAKLILSPRNFSWRLVPVTNRSAAALFSLALFLFAIRALSYMIAGVREVLDLPLQSSVMQAFIETVLVAFVLIIISRLKPLIVGEDPSQPGKVWPRYLRWPLFFTGLFLLLMSGFGYIALASFISWQIVTSGALLILVYFGLISAKSVMQEDVFVSSKLGIYLSDRFGYRPETLNRLGLILGIITHLIVIGVGLSLILLQWGFRSDEVLSGIYQLFTEFSVGGITVSFVNIFIGLALFAVGYLVTRRFQRWLDGNVLGRGKVEEGVRNSIRKVVGYAGVAVAAMFAVTAAGFDLSNLALVAGALSLGIGFGLQTIVSNFVSGLILLAERPFKTGDWVETTSVTGIVKEISVRATEIETFSRKTVIVPNSELVNAAVGNWNHRNSTGRVDVAIGVAYDHDPQDIMDLLIEIAKEHPKILNMPAPSVEFVDFGASSLDFNLRGFLANIGDGFDVRNELRVAIYRRFKQENIEIPFPHRELFIRQSPDSEST